MKIDDLIKTLQSIKKDHPKNDIDVEIIDSEGWVHSSEYGLGFFIESYEFDEMICKISNL